MSLAIRQPHNLGNLGEDKLSPICPCYQLLTSSRDTIFTCGYAHTHPYMQARTVHKRTARQKHVNNRNDAAVSSASWLPFVIRMSSKGAFNGTAHHSREWQHPDTLGVAYAAGAIKAPWQLRGLFQCHNKSLVLRSRALTPFYWELVRGRHVLHRGSSSRQSVSSQ